MRIPFLFIILLFTAHYSTAQSSFATSDFIVLKKKNNRTIKTFYPGVFISAYTYNDFLINGFIKDIRNDSIYIRQEDRRLVGTEFGTKLDTIAYTIGIDYRQIKHFNYKGYTWNRKKGFSQVTLPRIMMIGGTGYILLELINTAYRKESISQDHKLVSLGIAAAVVATGFALNKLQEKIESGGKYKVIYIKTNKPLTEPSSQPAAMPPVNNNE